MLNHILKLPLLRVLSMCHFIPKIFLITLENSVFKSLEILRIPRSLKHKCVQYDIKYQLLDFLQVNYQDLNKTHLLRELDTIQLIE